jgi:hypothetical protein
LHILRSRRGGRIAVKKGDVKGEKTAITLRRKRKMAKERGYV